jgi:hypothetical protein
MRDGEDLDGVMTAPSAAAPAESASAEGGFGATPSAPDGEDPREGAADEVDGDLFANAFTEEIENVAVSDWDVDADALWGGAEPEPYDLGTVQGSGAFDFPA